MATETKTTIKQPQGNKNDYKQMQNNHKKTLNDHMETQNNYKEIEITTKRCKTATQRHKTTMPTCLFCFQIKNYQTITKRPKN